MHDQEYVISALQILTARVKRKKGFEIKLSCNDELISILSDAVQMLKKQTDIVLCKDCVYFSSADENDANENLCAHIMMITKPDGFCVDGTKRE